MHTCNTRIDLEASHFNEITSNIFIVLPATIPKFFTNFKTFLPKLSCPNMELCYFDEKSTLVSAACKIEIRDQVEKNPRSILHGGRPIL